MTVIKPRFPYFQHAGELPTRYDRPDPRTSPLGEQVDVDLRECEFIRPAAASWMLVYLTLAAQRGSQCRLLVPANYGVCCYLKSLGLFDALKRSGVEVDDRNIAAAQDDHVILPLTPFASSTDAAAVTNLAFEKLRDSRFGAVNLTRVVAELFSELANNAAEHSGSTIGAFASIQSVQTAASQRFVCAVADGGIGVRETLCRNEALRSRVNYDWDALELAIRERVSGTGNPHRGIGLFGVSEDVRRPHHSLLLHSGLGSLQINEQVETQARRTRLFPGTLAVLSVPS